MQTPHFVTQYLAGLMTTLDSLSSDRFDTVLNSILNAYQDESRIFVMGNGGSGATASHFACDINKGCCIDLDKKLKLPEASYGESSPVRNSV